MSSRALGVSTASPGRARSTARVAGDPAIFGEVGMGAAGRAQQHDLGRVRVDRLAIAAQGHVVDAGRPSARSSRARRRCRYASAASAASASARLIACPGAPPGAAMPGACPAAPAGVAARSAPSARCSAASRCCASRSSRHLVEELEREDDPDRQDDRDDQVALVAHDGGKLLRAAAVSGRRRAAAPGRSRSRPKDGSARCAATPARGHARRHAGAAPRWRIRSRTGSSGSCIPSTGETSQPIERDRQDQRHVPRGSSPPRPIRGAICTKAASSSRCSRANGSDSAAGRATTT